MNDGFLNELNIEALIRIKENSWNGRNYLDLSDMLTTDTDVINYRLDALGDLLEYRDFYEAVKELIPEIMSYQELRTSSGLNSDIDDLYAVKEALEGAGYPILSAEKDKIASTSVTLTDADDLKFMGLLIEMLEEDDDVMNVYHNWENCD